MSEKKLSPLRQKDIRTGAKQERERIIALLEQAESACSPWAIALIKEGTE